MLSLVLPWVSHPAIPKVRSHQPRKWETSLAVAHLITSRKHRENSEDQYLTSFMMKFEKSNAFRKGLDSCVTWTKLFRQQDRFLWSSVVYWSSIRMKLVLWILMLLLSSISNKPPLPSCLFLNTVSREGTWSSVGSPYHWRSLTPSLFAPHRHPFGLAGTKGDERTGCPGNSFYSNSIYIKAFWTFFLLIGL